jgi:hypothetical protein
VMMGTYKRLVTLSAIGPIEDQTGADVIVGGGLPADRQDMGATTGTSDKVGTQEAAAAALREEKVQIRADLETTRPTRNPEDIAARQEKLRSIHERITTEEGEKKTEQLDRIVSMGKQLASLAPKKRWLSTLLAEMQQDQPKGHGAWQQQELEEEEGIMIRRSPGDYTKHLPWVPERVFLQTLCGLGNDKQGRCASSDVGGNGGRCLSGNAPGSRDQYVRGNAFGDCSRCASSKVQGDSGRCVSSGVRQSSDPGGGPEPETDYEPACGKLLGVLDEIQVLNRLTEVRMPSQPS